MEKNRREFVESNPSVKNWLLQKAKRSEETASQYCYLIYRYRLWLKEHKGYQNMQSLLEDYKKKKKQGSEYDHIDFLKEYMFNGNMILKAISYRQQNLSAIRGFYKFNRCALPDEKIDLTVTESDNQKAREKLGLKPMTLKDMRSLVSPMKIRDRAMMLILLQSGMGIGEFTKQFNICTCRKEWLEKHEHVCEPYKVMKQIQEGTCPVKIEFVGRKSNKKPYHTYIGKDAVEALKQYFTFRTTLIKTTRKRIETLEEKAKTEGLSSWEKHAFSNYRQKMAYLTPEWTPSQPIFMSNRFNSVNDKTIQAIVRNHRRAMGLTDREFTPHTCRNIFKTECAHVGVDNTISEFFIGHALDPYGYNRLDKMYPDDFLKEYLKVEPTLNIISGEGDTITKDEAENIIKQTEARIYKEYNAKLQKQVENAINKLFKRHVVIPEVESEYRSMVEKYVETSTGIKPKSVLYRVIETPTGQKIIICLGYWDNGEFASLNQERIAVDVAES